jgi:hypothetical protein
VVLKSVDHPALGASPVWILPGIQIHKARSWPRVSAMVVSRPAGEAIWRNEQYTLNITLTTSVQRATVQVESGRSRDLSRR